MTLLSIIWLQLVGTICKLPERDTYRRASRGRETLWVTLRTAAVSNSFQTDALTEEPSNHLDNRWLTVLLQEPLIESLSQPQNILHGLDGLFIPFQRCHNHICVIDWKLRTKNDPWMCIAGVNRYYTDVFFFNWPNQMLPLWVYRDANLLLKKWVNFVTVTHLVSVLKSTLVS